MSRQDPPARQNEIVTPIQVADLESRYNNRSRLSKASYPITSPDELEIKMEELVFGFTRPRNLTGANRPGITSERGFTSFNGLVPTAAAGIEDFMDQLYLVGVCRTNYNPFDKQQPRNGISVTRTLGPVRVAWDMVPKTAYPGDLLVWTVPGYPGDKHLMPGGQFGLSSKRPRSKLTGYLEPYEPARVGDYFQRVFEHMMSDTDGVHDLPPNSSIKGLPPNYQAALAMREFSLFAPLRAIDILQNRGLLTINTPAERQRQQLIDRFLEDGTTPNGFADTRQGLNEALATVSETDPTDVRGNNRYMSGGGPGGGMQAEEAITTKDRSYFASDQHRDPELTAAQKDRLRLREQKNVLFLATLLGAIGDTSTGNMTSMAVRDDVLLGMYGEFASDSLGTTAYFPNMIDVAQEKGSPLARQYVEGAIYAPRQLSAALNEAKHAYERRICARSLSYAKGGGQLDEKANVYLIQ